MQEAQSIKDNTPDAIHNLDQHTKTIWSDTNKQQPEQDEQEKNNSPAPVSDCNQKEHTKTSAERTESNDNVPHHKMIEQGSDSRNSVPSCHPEALRSKEDTSNENITASYSHVAKGKTF